jgi:VWFA-related protein
MEPVLGKRLGPVCRRLMVCITASLTLYSQTLDSGYDDLRVRVSVTLVQLDAVVTDAHGNHISGLGKDDFEVFLDGKPQQIAAFNFVSGAQSASTVAGIAANKKPPSSKLLAAYPPAPVATIRPEDVRRTIAIFVDDLSVAPQHVPFIQRALHSFIDRQMEPGDLVAIVRASAGLGALQDFVTDKNLLRAAADQVRWNPNGNGTSVFQFNSPMAEQEARFRAEYFVVSVVDSLSRLVQGIAALPGRKSVIVLSDSLPMVLPQYYNDLGLNTVNSYESTEPLNVFDRMLRLVDAATRASVVFYGVDTREGMPPLETAGRTQLPESATITNN